MAKKALLYILKKNYKPVSWQLRNTPLVHFEGKGLRRLIYVKGGHSIWRDEYDSKLEVQSTPVWFEHGKLYVNAHDTLLISYLEKHPDFNLKFKLDNPEAEAEKQLQFYKKQDQVKEELGKLTSFDALCEALSRKDETTLHLSPSEKELRCYKEAAANPDKVIKAMQDPLTETKHMVAVAFSKNIISVNPTKTQIVWADTRQAIIPTVAGKKNSEVLAEYLFEPNGEGVLLELNKRILELNPIQKKTTRSRKTKATQTT